MSDEATFASHRNKARDSLFLSTDIVVANYAHPITVRVRNLSAGGMMIDSHDAIVDGAEIATDLRGIGPVTGRIAWVMAGRAGVSFDLEIDPKKARTPVGQSQSTVYKRPVLDQTSRPGLKNR
jgi:PilZ domain